MPKKRYYLLPEALGQNSLFMEMIEEDPRTRQAGGEAFGSDVEPVRGIPGAGPSEDGWHICFEVKAGMADAYKIFAGMVEAAGGFSRSL